MEAGTLQNQRQIESQDVDVVVVTYNSPPLPESTCALAAADGFHLLMIDNASDHLPEVPHGAVLQASSENVGFARACNRAINCAGSPYILFLNPDCEISVENVKRLLDVARNFDKGGGVVVGARAVGQIGQRVLPAGREPRAMTFMLQYLGLAARCQRAAGFNVYDHLTPDRPIEVDWVGGGCLLISRDLFTQLGGFTERFFMYAEDVDLCLRAKDRGATVILAGNVPASHPVGTGSPAPSRLRMSWMRNLRAVVQARHGRFARIRFDLALIVGAGMVNILRVVGKRPTLGRPDLALLLNEVFADDV